MQDCWPRWDVHSCYWHGQLTNSAFLNIYAPNFDCPKFFCKVINLVTECNCHNFIVGGDFNCYFDVLLDRSSSKGDPLLKSVPDLNNLAKSLGLVDIWRHQHYLVGQYSRLIYSRLISKVINTTYHSILISDHAPLSMEIDFNLHAPHYNWKLNLSVLRGSSK